MGVVSGEPVRLSKPQIDKFYETFSDTKILGSDGETVIGKGPDSCAGATTHWTISFENPGLFPGGYIGFRESQMSGDFERPSRCTKRSARPTCTRTSRSQMLISSICLLAMKRVTYFKRAPSLAA